MKLKMISASCIPEAMAQARQTFGDEAVIVSSLRLPNGGVRLIIAASENEQVEETKLQSVLFERKNLNQGVSCEDKIRALLTFHRVPELLIERLMQGCLSKPQNDVLTTLTGGIRDAFTFSPINFAKTKRAFLLTGIAGSGKTTVLIKWAASAKMKGLKVALITLDNKKAGAIQGLEAFANVLQVPLIPLENAMALNSALDRIRETADLILIDTPALNPWQATDMALLADVNRCCSGVEPILIMQAGLDALEAGEIASCFARFGCARMIVTRLDIFSIYGGILNAVWSGGVSLAHYTSDSMPSEPLQDFSPDVLSSLLIKNISDGDKQ